MKNQSIRLFKKLLLLSSFCFSAAAGFAQQDTLQNSLFISSEHTHFDKQFADDWQVTSLAYRHQTKLGSLLGRINYANRFAQHGWQAEGEMYPVISQKIYAYTGFSYSNNVPVFPQWRAGATVYYNLSKGWEAEGGFRYLFFEDKTWLGTVGASKYLGAWLLNARSFFSIQSPTGNQSFFLKAQRFLKNEKDFVWLQVGSGVSPDDNRNIQLSALPNLQTKQLAAGAKLSVSRQMQFLLSAGFTQDEYRTKTIGHQYTGSFGAEFRF